jgi:hypothetical protein
MPPHISIFDAYLYAEVPRKVDKILPCQFGDVVRIDPAKLQLQKGIITVNIPLDINVGIYSIDDLECTWFESIEAAFLNLMVSCSEHT